MLWEHKVAGSIPAIPNEEYNMKQNIIETLLNKKYKKKWEEDEGAICFENDTIVVAIFDHDYPNEDRKGRIFAEHKKHFDRWWSAFYKCDMPKNDMQLGAMMGDLLHIQSTENYTFGEGFGTLTRTF